MQRKPGMAKPPGRQMLLGMKRPVGKLRRVGIVMGTNFSDSQHICGIAYAQTRLLLHSFFRQVVYYFPPPDLTQRGQWMSGPGGKGPQKER